MRQRPGTLSGRKGSFYMAPANAASYWEGQGDHQPLMLALPKQDVDRILAPCSDADADRILGPVFDREIINAAIPSLMNRIWDHSHQDGPGAALHVDGMFLSLLGVLADLSDAVATRDGKVVQPLDQRRLVDVSDYIDAHLDQAISLMDLAGVAGQSIFHFARCFKAATNMTPHLFVTKRRVEESRALLVETEDTLADIAYACGFSSQAYFTTKFKEHFGTTPGAYRSSMCN